MQDDDTALRTRKKYVGLFIIAVMVLSAFGFVLSYAQGEKSNRYNGFKFSPYRNQWQVTIDGIKTTFNYHPSDLESINLSGNITSVFNGPVVVLTYDPRSNFSAQMAEEQYFMGVSLHEHGRFALQALTNASGTELQELSCANATAEQPVVEFREDDSTGIVVVGSCVIARGANQNDFYPLGERLLYSAYGVMP